MASVGHVVVGMAAARWHHGAAAREQLVAAMLGWSLLSLLPDADVVGFSFGVDYHDAWGHRGASHSMVVALLVGVAGGLFARFFGGKALQVGALAAAVVASHGLLDSLTDGGLGPALLWPFTDDRYFSPWNPIPVAPIGLRFLSPAGLGVALTEILLFSPLLVYALWPRTERAAEADRGVGVSLQGMQTDQKYPVEKTDEEWRNLLTPEQYAVLREHATESPGSCALLREHRAGTFTCAGCGQLLFVADRKFESGTGWPSFFEPLDGALGRTMDTSFGMTRIEVHCSRCGGHLGHVFNDGPPPTGLRYCINGVALEFEPATS